MNEKEFAKLIEKQFNNKIEKPTIDDLVEKILEPSKKLEEIVNKTIKEMIGQFINIEGKDKTRIVAECRMIGLGITCEHSCFIDKYIYRLLYKRKFISEFYVETAINKDCFNIYTSELIDRSSDELKRQIRDISTMTDKTFKDGKYELMFDFIGTNSDHKYTPKEIINYYKNIDRYLEPKKIELNRTTITFLDKFDVDKLDVEVKECLGKENIIVAGNVELHEANIIYRDGSSKLVSLFEEEEENEN